ncbi:unnamed protein product [Cylicocyclus nassatus]|uniref:L-threonine 3-dehydrogenase, mitochondrial n=1 Tax=Cylicocyclus nassatus TaxID=53992 RepID=A0AA36GER8_CYLNA|nr:unnamed protein product [Cylicocyclus nassatus]
MASAPRKLLRNAVSLVNVTTKRNYALPPDPLARFKALASANPEPPRVLITGSLGQLGRGLNTVYKYMYGEGCVTMTDIVKLPTNAVDVSDYAYLDVLNRERIEQMVVDKGIDTIVHYSALLSAIGEQNVPLALQVNCHGVENVLEVAKRHNLKIFIPSTIGAFGPTTPPDNVPDVTIQCPTTIYGVSKVFAERLGEYYHHRFGVDFRSLRFPGIISATKPGGGTTDYAIQIFYDALEKGKHTCYLKPDTRLPMMYDTDCMASVVQFLATPAKSLTHRVYNVTGFSFTPAEIAAAIKKVMPHFEIEYEICPIRQGIADSWPNSLDDSEAKKDWGWHIEYGMDEMVEVMLALIQRNAQAQAKQSTDTQAAKL